MGGDTNAVVRDGKPYLFSEGMGRDCNNRGFSPVVGSEQGGVRPVLIIQNDTGNRYSPTVIAAAITSQTGKTRLPTHIDLPVDQSCGLSRDSVVLLEQVRTLDKKRLRERMGHVEENVMSKVDTAIAVSFGLPHDQLV